MTQDLRIPLDESVPFVRSIRAIIDGQSDYHEAVSLLIEAENRHGVRLIYDHVTGPRALGLIPRHEELQPSMSEVIQLTDVCTDG